METALGALEGKVAVVTGGASGIGEATARQCATAGARVIIADIQPLSAAMQRCGIAAHQTDVAESAQVAALMHWTVTQYGRLDILVNAAGISGGSAPTAEYSEADFDRVIAVNLKGVFLGMKHALVEMVRGGGGAIVNIASILGLVGMARTPAYSAAKGGVIQLTRTAAVEYAARNIRVNCICPGVIDTPMVRNALAPGPQVLVDRQPIGRMGTAEEVAAAAVFLASDAATFTTGAALTVDGGFVAQ